MLDVQLEDGKAWVHVEWMKEQRLREPTEWIDQEWWAGGGSARRRDGREGGVGLAANDAEKAGGPPAGGCGGVPSPAPPCRVWPSFPAAVFCFTPVSPAVSGTAASDAFRRAASPAFRLALACAPRSAW